MKLLAITLFFCSLALCQPATPAHNCFDGSGKGVPCATVPGDLSALDKANLEKTDAQLKLLQIQFQEQAKPYVDEQNSILARVCAEVGAKPQIDCTVDIQAGKVTKRPQPPAQPAAKK